MDTNDYIREDVASIRRLASGDPDARQIYDKLADDRLVRHAANAMQEKLQLARVKGRGGWWNSDECTIEHLRTLLREHVEKGDMRDVLNLAAMVYVREIADMRPNKWSPAALVHELFTAAQLAPGEGIENAVGRLAALVEAQQPAPSEQQPFGWIKQSEIDSSNDFGGSINLWRQKYDCDVPVYLAQQPAPSAVADLIAALEEARRAINSMKVEAETAAQGDEQMMLEACETISNEGLQADMAIRAALASAPKPSPTPQAASQPAPVRDYPPLPDFETVEQHIYGACRRYITQDMLEPIHNLIRDVIDADRAAKEGDPQ